MMIFGASYMLLILKHRHNDTPRYVSRKVYLRPILGIPDREMRDYGVQDADENCPIGPTSLPEPLRIPHA